MAPDPISPHKKDASPGTKPARRRKRGRPKAKNPASVYLTIRLSQFQKERLEKRARAVGYSASEYIRRVMAADLDDAPPPEKPIPGQTTVQEQVAEVGDALTKGSAAKAPPPAKPKAPPVEPPAQGGNAGEAEFIAHRTKQLFGQGKTTRVARNIAQAEWRAKTGS